MAKLLNVGCGAAFHPSWTNIDLVSSSPNVQSYDIRKGLPYPDSYFDACYHSHVLEHQTQSEAEKFLAECWRVLKPQGILRVVVPDLEGLVRHYLQALENVEAGIKKEEPNYDWMMLELYDQTVRTCSGGEMRNYLKSQDIKNKEFILSRIGWQAELYWKKDNQENTQSLKTIIQKLSSKKIARLSNKMRMLMIKKIVTLMAGQEGGQAFAEGYFRQCSGEIHRWMYDRFSLKRLLEKTGFAEVQVCSADKSQIPEFNSYELDIIEGKVRKPDSLFMEGIKVK
ncbi:MAG TPA: methyltransferase [Cyanobacteria bacterium UBA8803]|nr:methyltransferase [Cyanobacteria bacterium UBA9273]HBL62829.1 methyltransferase [Cyanobacteria bacterium UBA8803]